jgi:hypothetical protein
MCIFKQNTSPLRAGSKPRYSRSGRSVEGRLIKSLPAIVEGLNRSALEFAVADADEGRAESLASQTETIAHSKITRRHEIRIR